MPFHKTMGRYLINGGNFLGKTPLENEKVFYICAPSRQKVGASEHTALYFPLVSRALVAKFSQK
ncbi:MAG: hypothetical protein ACI9J3_001254 [Parvicellaceae bacterium]|jgi:hypothetical protein